MNHHKKIAKTNASRILDQQKIHYELRQILIQEEHMDATEIAKMLHVSPEKMYKTLVAEGDKTGTIVACIPANKELDLKLLAKVSGNKKVEMLPMKDLEKVTGYIRGGCSPIGMKKRFPTFIADDAKNQEQLFISAGKRGLQLAIAPMDLVQVTNANFEDIYKTRV
ncbi:Cys-tRNA(Pro) deacylase [Listeria riparia]|uniref:Cys-tRNA(Pro)/Cys-tRNA(Cys) deacylase n=1 Tax=Listeria riparia FSL S10-1204 TaxID=1265816 RepID=W7D1F3_9LIST|nr:Cys-tRNA(Pro) deacylase [Listeria riparia]EUJ42997.1 ybaK / prolyl-tRNA synthetases associated domain-containing protein [Listeria riparia FSL S10-1204]